MPSPFFDFLISQSYVAFNLSANMSMRGDRFLCSDEDKDTTQVRLSHLFSYSFCPQL